MYEIAEEMHVDVFSFGLNNNEAVSLVDGEGDCFIAIDSMILAHEQDEKMKLTHELGHCATGALYSQHTPLMTREICEARATRW
jgi:hypothetical protein